MLGTHRWSWEWWRADRWTERWAQEPWRRAAPETATSSPSSPHRKPLIPSLLPPPENPFREQGSFSLPKPPWETRSKKGISSRAFVGFRFCLHRVEESSTLSSPYESRTLRFFCKRWVKKRRDSLGMATSTARGMRAAEEKKKNRRHVSPRSPGGGAVSSAQSAGKRPKGLLL